MNTPNTIPAVWSKAVEDEPWVRYEDPHLPSGDDAALVKILPPNVFVAWFPPGYAAPSHSHPYDTTYYVIDGAIRFGEEGWVRANSVRAVTAGWVYGPEEAGDQGVTFLLVSSGPIGINWDES